MAYSTQSVVSDGTLTLLQVSIDYFDRDDITVMFDGVPNAHPWSWVGVTDRTISFSPAIPAGVVVLLQRNTDIAEPRHIFTLGAQFTAESMDEDFRQVLQIAQEAKEGGWGESTSELRADLALPTGSDIVGHDPASGPNTSVGNELRAHSASIAALVTDLANPSDMSKGVTLVSGAPRVVSNVTALRALPGSGSQHVTTEGYTTRGDGGGGAYYRDSADTTSADNGRTVIVGTDGSRWKPADLREFDAKRFGITSSGDQYQRYQNAMVELSGLGGGILKMPYGLSSIIDGILNIPDNVVLQYDGGLVGHAGPNNIPLRAGKLILPTGAKITLNNGSGLRGLSIIRDGTSFVSDSATIATWASKGDAVVLLDTTTDAFIEDCGIFGFAQAIRSVAGATNVSRTRLRRIQIDCTAGVLLENAYDIPYIDQVHCWPFCSVAAPGEPLGAHLLRPGTAFKFGDVDDWLKVQNCFNYGYYRGFHVGGADNVTLISCGSDYVPDVVADGSIGFLVDGNSREATLIACQAAARTHGFYINTPATEGTHVLDTCSSWECDTNHVVLEQGRAMLKGHRARGGAGSNGVFVAGTFDKAVLVGNSFKDLGTGISQALNTTRVYESSNIFDNVTTRRSSPYKPTVASADPLVLDGESLNFEVTGDVSFGMLSAPADYAGKVVALKFTGSPTVYDGGNMKLEGNVSFAATPDDTILFYSDGQFFYELKRSVN